VSTRSQASETATSQTAKIGVGLPVWALAGCYVAAQAATLVLSPILVAVADDFGVSVSVAGQLRSVSGAVAGAGALAVGLVVARFGHRSVLLGGLVTLAVASGLSAIAPTFVALSGAQILLGLSIVLVQATAIAGVTVWITRGARAQALSWILPGAAFAWIVGMPIVGVVGAVSWRLAWLTVPLAVSLPVIALVWRLPPRPHAQRSRSGHLRRTLRNPNVAGWAFGELCAYSATAGFVVYLGALMIESYGVSLTTAGLVLGLAMIAYLPGSLLFRRWIDTDSRALLIGLGLAGALTAALLGAVRPSLAVTALLTALFLFVNAGRTISSSAFGLDAAPDRATTTMGILTSTRHFGYLVGGVAGGVALTLGGYTALGLTFAALYVLGTVPHVFRAFRYARSSPSHSTGGTPHG